MRLVNPAEFFVLPDQKKFDSENIKNQYLHFEMTNQFKYKFSCCPCGTS